MDRRQRLFTLGIAAVIAVIAVVVVLATTGGSDDEQTVTTQSTTPAVSTAKGGAEKTTTPPEPDAEREPPPIAIEVKDGKPVGGITKIRVKQGDRITFTVKADVADEVHVHAYDFHKDIEAPGDTVKFDFKATITGITEAELEDAGVQIASIRVDP